MKRLHRLLAALSILSLATFSLATATRAYDVMPASDPETLGFSPSRLARLAAWQQTQVDAGAFSGAVAAIAPASYNLSVNGPDGSASHRSAGLTPL